MMPFALFFTEIAGTETIGTDQMLLSYFIKLSFPFQLLFYSVISDTKFEL